MAFCPARGRGAHRPNGRIGPCSVRGDGERLTSRDFDGARAGAPVNLDAIARRIAGRCADPSPAASTGQPDTDRLRGRGHPAVLGIASRTALGLASAWPWRATGWRSESIRGPNGALVQWHRRRPPTLTELVGDRWGGRPSVLLVTAEAAGANLHRSFDIRCEVLVAAERPMSLHPPPQARGRASSWRGSRSGSIDSIRHGGSRRSSRSGRTPRTCHRAVAAGGTVGCRDASPTASTVPTSSAGHVTRQPPQFAGGRGGTVSSETAWARLPSRSRGLSYPISRLGQLRALAVCFYDGVVFQRVGRCPTGAFVIQGVTPPGPGPARPG